MVATMPVVLTDRLQGIGCLGVSRDVRVKHAVVCDF